LWKQRSVSAVASDFFVAEARFLEEFCARCRGWSARGLGAWLGAFARAEGRRVIYTPHWSVRLKTLAGRNADLPLDGRRGFHARFPDCMPETRWYPRLFGLDANHLYQAVPPGQRRDHLRRLAASEPTR